MVDVEINIWKESGKFYTQENIKVSDIVDVDTYVKLLKRYSGMFATTSYYIEKESYYQPYRLFKL